MEKFKNHIIYKDGEFINSSNSGVDYFSQTLHYGFGAFEGIRSYQTINGTKLFKARQHFERLEASCKQVYLPFSWDIDQLIADTYKLLEANELTNAYIRPIVYAEADMSMITSTKAHIVIVAWQWDAFYGDKTLNLCFSSYQKPSKKALPINAKITGNYINSVLAITEAKNKGFDEAILIDENGFVTETTSANIFIEKNGRLITPKADNIMPGITRATIFKIAEQLDIEVSEQNITSEELKGADSLFLCGTAVEIIGVNSIEGTVFPVKFPESLGANIQRVYKSLVLDKLSFEVII